MIINNIHFLYVILYILIYDIVMMLYLYHEMQNIVNFIIFYIFVICLVNRIYMGYLDCFPFICCM